MSDKNPLISNVSPPTELPSFILQQQPAKEPEKTEAGPVPAKFAAAIPSQQEPEDQQKIEANTHKAEEEVESELPSMQEIAQALSPITDGVKNSVLFGWVKDAVKSGMTTGVAAAKAVAKESIDKVVTTLDPQMSQLICKQIELLRKFFDQLFVNCEMLNPFQIQVEVLRSL